MGRGRVSLLNGELEIEGEAGVELDGGRLSTDGRLTSTRSLRR